MPLRRDLDRLLKDWPFQAGSIGVRLIQAADGRDVLQMRVDLGILQLEVERRPDGQRPGGADTYLDYLLGLEFHVGESFELTDEQCSEVEREFAQYYHRRICWLALEEYRHAVRDADHTLNLMDFVKRHSPSEDWTAAHEQHRPFVIFQRTQALTRAELEDHGANAAIEAIGAGLERMRAFFSEYLADERFESDEMVAELVALRERLRSDYELGRSLEEQLAEAVAAEKYELAARLRDQITQARRGGRA